MAAGDRFSRFKNIEKGRAEEATGKPTSSSGRFGALERQPEAPPVPEAASPVVVPERFTPAAPPGPAVPRTLEDVRRLAQAPSGLELAEVRPGDQPFVRCVRCNTDNHALATTCSACGTSLNTLEQRAFNERVWAEHQAVLEKAAAEPAPGAPLPAPAKAVDLGLPADQQRALAEAVAREVAAKTRAELGGGGGSTVFRDEYNFAEWFLAHVPPMVANALVVGALVLSAALMAYKHTRMLGFAVSILVGVTLFRLYMARS